MWRVASAAILILYAVFVAFYLLLAVLFGHDPAEHQPSGGWWRYVLVMIFEVGVGLLCIYLSVRLFRRRRIRTINLHDLEPAAPAKSLLAVMALAFGWLSVFFGLGLRFAHVVELFTHPWQLRRWGLWSIVAIVSCWILVGLLSRPRAAVADEAASAGS